MKKNSLIFFVSTLCTILLIFFLRVDPAFSQQKSNQFHSYLHMGIQKAFNLEFSEAIDYLQKAVGIDPENPTGYAYLAMIDLFIYEMTFDDNTRNNLQASMLRRVEETLARGEKRIAQNPQDSNAYLAMALAKFTRFNWATRQKQYLNMARESSRIWEYLEKAKECDPHNYDLYFLMGSFRYHIDRLPGLTRFVSSLIITSGDKIAGLQELEIAAQKGDMLKHLALSELSSDYLNFEKQPARALPILRELKEIFPDNYNFSFALANALSDLHKYDEAFNIAGELGKKIRLNKPPFIRQLQPRHDQLMGRIFFTKGEYEKAEEYMNKALEDNSMYNARVRVLAYLRLGMICDIRNDRKNAEDYYRKALDVRGGEGAAQIEAKKYLKAPYTVANKN